MNLQGLMGAVANPVPTILGVTVDTTAIQDSNFKGVDGDPIGQTAFFNTAHVGGLVKAQGEPAGGNVSRNGIELED